MARRPGSRNDNFTFRSSDDERWKADGACVDRNPLWWAQEDPRAKAICLNECPVREQCLHYVTFIIGRKIPGVWGGTTHAERNPNSTPPGISRGPGGRFVKETT